MPQELENITVQGLMEVNTRAWDRQVIHDIVNNRDEELILKIPLPVGDRNDTWFWYLETEGNFTVKSVYRMLQGEHALPHKRFWNKVLPGDTVFKVLSRVFDRYNEEQIVQVARNLLYDWRKMLQDKQKNNIVVQLSSRTWSPPPLGYVKVNLDIWEWVL
ncbi:hypothetical protein AgCh_009733 [Apium graveolens]